MKTTLNLYCRYQMSGMNNFTATNLAEHYEGLSHDSVHRFLKEHRFTPLMVWENVRDKLEPCEEGYVIFDDTVLDKNYSFEIDLVRSQWSGNAHAVIKGIGVVNMVYYNPCNKQRWIIDFRIFDPERDHKSKTDHVKEMLAVAKERKLVYRTVLVDSWYATTDLMNYLEREEKYFYVVLKNNRLVDDSGGKYPYFPVSQLEWTEQEQKKGKLLKIKGTMATMKVKLFRAIASTGDTEYIVTNDITQCSAQDAQQKNALRWKIEQFHREEKQLTGIEKCQCRLNRSQRNHLTCCILAWVCLAYTAYQSGKTLYQVKKEMTSNYLVNQLKKPLTAI
jgi:hypothetical protein